MDHFQSHFESSSSNQDDEKVEPGDLLEMSWFFGNLLDRKTRMLRCFSDSSSSSQYGHEVLVRDSNSENSSPMSKLVKSDGFVRPKLFRTPSMPNSRSGGEETRENQEKEGAGSRMGKYSAPRSARNSLQRAPSPPPCIGKEDVFQDTESDFSMGKLIRQASLNISDLLPPKYSPKGMKQGSSTQRHVWQTKPEPESINVDSCNGMRHQYIANQRKMRKSLSDLDESEEAKGYRDLAVKFGKSDLNKNVVKAIPGLKSKNRVENEEDEDNVKRPYHSKSWVEQSSSPSVPKWVDKRSEQDIKAQIKFWARAVATNVRQEC